MFFNILMTALLLIFYIFCTSFIIMLIIVHFAPEYIEDNSGNLVARNKENVLQRH
jgi:hypothetical protein